MNTTSLRPVAHGQTSDERTGCYCGFCPPERKHCYYRRVGESFKFHVRFREKGRVRSAYRLSRRSRRTLLIVEAA